VRYLARGTGYTVYLTGADAGATIAVVARARSRPVTATPAAPTTVRTVLRLRPLGGRPRVGVEGLDRLPGVTRYVQGTRTLRVPTYRRVLYRGVYPVYYGTDGRLEYDWRLAPHVDARQIRLAVAGAGALRLAPDGSLLLTTGAGVLRQARPRAAQTRCSGVYFRDTSEGFPGSPTLQRVGVTPATTDPAIATIFATESENHGAGVLSVATASDLSGIEIAEGNFRAQLEAEAALVIAPSEFPTRASVRITAAQARSILARIGVHIPGQISGYAAADDLVRNTPRLTQQQIDEFVHLAKSSGG